MTSASCAISIDGEEDSEMRTVGYGRVPTILSTLSLQARLWPCNCNEAKEAFLAGAMVRVCPMREEPV
eukprot:1122382-Prorocentrum_minimum.AAC.1